MAEAKAVIAIINRATREALTDLRMVLSAIEGSYVRAFRENPSIRGLQAFLDDARSFPDTAQRFVLASLTRVQDELLPYRTAVDPDAPGSEQLVSLTGEQVRGMFDTLVVQEARKFRLHVASRTSVIGARLDLRLLNRAGQQFKAEEMLFLTVRKAMLDLFNEGQIAGLVAEGATEAQVYHFNPTHEDHGRRISLDPLSQEELAEVFHPRSGAVIGRIP